MAQVHAFIGTAAPANSDAGRPTGARRKLIILLRQEAEEEPNWARAAAAAETNGWIDLRLERGGSVVRAEALNDGAEYLKSAYEDAVTSGCSFIVYDATERHDA